MSIETANAVRLTRAEQKNAALVEDVEFLIAVNAGEARIMQALGYTSKTALKRRLMRLHRHDLIPQIFEADAAYKARHDDMGIGTATARKARTA